jgi:transcriptional antiterminator RfaH
MCLHGCGAWRRRMAEKRRSLPFLLHVAIRGGACPTSVEPMLPSFAVEPTGQLLPWYALKVRTRSEPMAVTALSNRGYFPFAPSIPERRRYSDRMAVVPAPIFPGYVFCRFDVSGKVTVLSCPAVEYIVSFAGAPAIVPDEEIEAVRRAVEAGGRPRSYLAIGQRIRIEFGPLTGLEGILDRTAKGNRLVVSVHLLQRSVSVEIDEDQVRAIFAASRKPASSSPALNNRR